MTESIIIAIIASIPPTFVALLALFQAIKSRKAIQEVHLSLNSRLDALLKAEKSVSKQEGRDEIK